MEMTRLYCKHSSSTQFGELQLNDNGEALEVKVALCKSCFGFILGAIGACTNTDMAAFLDQLIAEVKKR